MCYTPDVLLRLASPPVNDRGPMYMDQALAAIHQANSERLPIELLFGSHADTVGLYCRCPDSLAPLVQRQFHGCYPDAKIDRLDDATFAAPAGWRTSHLSLSLAGDVFSLKTYRDFEDLLARMSVDPLMSILAMLPGPQDANLRGHVSLKLRPITRRRLRWAEHAEAVLTHPLFHRWPRLAYAYSRLTASPWLPLRVLARCVPAGDVDRQEHDRKLGKHLYDVRLRITMHAAAGHDQLARDRLQQLAGGILQFRSHRLAVFDRCPRANARPFLLSTTELATLYHFPTTQVRTETLASLPYRELGPPTRLPTRTADTATPGRTAFRSRRVGLADGCNRQNAYAARPAIATLGRPRPSQRPSTVR